MEAFFQVDRAIYSELTTMQSIPVRIAKYSTSAIEVIIDPCSD
jgi:hypothetical protein